LFEKPREIEVVGGLVGHGGGYPVLLNNLFGENVGEDRFGRAADHIDGARSILTGVAANRSLRTEGVVLVKDILDLKPWVKFDCPVSLSRILKDSLILFFAEQSIYT
jgi:hypothetical protein